MDRCLGVRLLGRICTSQPECVPAATRPFGHSDRQHASHCFTCALEATLPCSQPLNTPAWNLMHLRSRQHIPTPRILVSTNLPLPRPFPPTLRQRRCRLPQPLCPPTPYQDPSSVTSRLAEPRRWFIRPIHPPSQRSGTPLSEMITLCPHMFLIPLQFITTNVVLNVISANSRQHSVYLHQLNQLK